MIKHKWYKVESTPEWLEEGLDSISKCIRCGTVRLWLVKSSGKVYGEFIYSKDFNVKNFVLKRPECNSDETIKKEIAEKKRNDRLDKAWSDLGNTLAKGV